MIPLRGRADGGSTPLGPADNLRRVWLYQVLTITVLMQAAVFAGRPMTSYRVLDLGGGSTQVGLVAACFAVLPLVLAVPAGRAVDGNLAPTFLRVGAVMSIVGPVTMALSPTVWMLAAGNAVAGVGLLLSAIASQGLIARRARYAAHDRAFGMFTVAASTGQLIGPLAGGYAAAHALGVDSHGVSPQAGLWAAAVLASVGALLTLRLARPRSTDRVDDDPADPSSQEVPGPRDPVAGMSTPRPTVLGMLRIRGMPPAVLASLSLLSCVDLITAFLPVLGTERGVSATAVGWLLAARALASIASRLMVARLARRWGRRRLLVASMGLSAVLLALLPIFSGLVFLVSLMLMTGFLLGIGQPVTMSWVTGLVTPSHRSTALAVRLSGNRVGQVVVPSVAGALAGVMGAAGVFLLMAALLATAGGTVAAHRES